VNGTGPVKRVTIWVRDAERSLALYRDTLGLEVLEDKRIGGAAIAAMIGLEEAQLRIVHLAPRGAEHGWIGLYELSRTNPAIESLPAPPAERPAYGQTTIVFTTDRMEEILPRLHAGGTRFLTEPREYVKTTPGDATPPGRYTEAIFFDPDGVMVSLIGYRA
jgi:catechol 2,3-dioxygenase-like lactoylglutathione lyase family enzyme